MEDILNKLATIIGWDERRRNITKAFIGERLLSGFQLRAAQAVLRSSNRDAGTVLTAGTGSGKTLAFYLPIALELAPQIRQAVFWTKVVAVFPRIELLKDQFTQAYDLLSPLAPVLRQQGGRPFRLGTLFSGTPRNSTPEVVETAGWRRSGQGYICPFLLCPNCRGTLIWLDHDLSAGNENLTCADGCGTQVGEDEIILTRERARREPPDFLFTTAETMNQRLSDTAYRHVLGITDDRSHRARFLLLDEIHTYGGTSGAQTALVLRRWRHAMGLTGSIRYLGLSATLEDASRFFSELTGLWPSSVTEVSPREEELMSQSMEYQLILRGDPSSRTQLLSTTIQASFLLARLLDPLFASSPSQGRYGSRVFAFTDDLDATNRLFDFLRDAEARDIFGNPDGNRSPLAALRAANQPDRDLRIREGQDWGHLEHIGRPLAQRLTIGRTSSQDRGVDQDSDIIVATAALEVGFNDSTVGAIVQHRSPHQLSAFVQRKGRAGRNPTMRPWMVTVLSDYGRDRLTYQSYDHLFDPILKPNSLPVRNRYVLRMQATFAMLDWLAVTNTDLRGWWWQPLNGPADRDGLWRSQQQRALASLLGLLEESGQRRQSLSNHVRRALNLDSMEEVNEILWGSPRSLLLEVIPTLARRLETNWELSPALQDDGSTDLVAAGPPHPLPEFLPGNLFSDLNLPEVTIVLPPATRNRTERMESMPIVQALGQLAPGRVTRRFAPERGKLNHWIPVPLSDGEHLLRINDYAERYELVTNISIRQNGVIVEIPCYRPWTVRLNLVPDREVTSTSNAWQQWQTQLIPQGNPIRLSTGHDPQWGTVVQGFHFYMHAFHAPVTVRRFSLEANATVKTPPPSRQEFNVTTRYVDTDGTQVAVGFEQEVDAVLIQLSLPETGELVDRASIAPSTPIWRVAYFRDRVLNDPELSSVCNWFQRDWLQQMMLTSLVETAVSYQNNLPNAYRTLLSEGLSVQLRNVATRIFAMELDTVTGNEELPTESDDSVHGEQLDQRWEDLLANQVVLQRLEVLAPELWDAAPDLWGEWLRSRTHETIGEALLAASYLTTPDHVAEDSLLLDIDRGMPDFDPNQNLEVWLTEAALGGSGAVEALAREATQDPRRLIRALEATVAPGDVELTATSLEAFVNALGEDQILVDAVKEVRRRTGHDERIAALNVLYHLLGERGFSVDQGFKIALNHRILREGTGELSDGLLRDLIAQWHTWESQFGVAIDLRSFALVVASNAEFGPRIRELGSGNIAAQVTIAEATGIISGLLWPRAGEVSGRTFQSYRQFRNREYTNPSFIRELIVVTGPETIIYQADGWLGNFNTLLADIGMARIWVATEYEAEFHEEIFQILADPVDVDYLQFYPVITEVNRGSGITITFVLREMF
ncbi:protein DpdJ [Chloroflexota bacterium]